MRMTVWISGLKMTLSRHHLLTYIVGTSVHLHKKIKNSTFQVTNDWWWCSGLPWNQKTLSTLLISSIKIMKLEDSLILEEVRNISDSATESCCLIWEQCCLFKPWTLRVKASLTLTTLEFYTTCATMFLTSQDDKINRCVNLFYITLRMTG